MTARIPPIQCLLTFEALARLRSVSLTTEGSEYLAHVREGLEVLGRFPGRDGAGKRKLRVAVTPTFARSILMPRLRGFIDAYPESVEDLLAAKLIRSPLEPWRTWFDAHGVDAPEPGEGSSFNDIGLLCDAAAQGLGIALVRLKLGQPWLDNGTLERISERNVPSPHAHYLCWRTGTMDRWECAAFAEWLKKSLV